MQLACPNCDAKYEVPDDAIPEPGRDVQCSACGHAWFEVSPPPGGGAAFDVEETAETGAFADPRQTGSAPAPAADFTPPEFAQTVTQAVTQTAADPAPVPAPAAAAFAAPAAATGPAYDEDDEEGAAPFAARPGALPPGLPPLPRRELEDSVIAILREEAELEAEARRAEAQRAANRRLAAEAELQTQPDLGLDQAPSPAMTAAQKRLAFLRGEDSDEADAEESAESQDPALAPASPRPAVARRDLLPDVEEINSTLKPEENGFDPDAEVEALPDLTRGNPFRTGFLLALVTLLAGTLLYLFADDIAAFLPAAESGIQSFVGFVDGLRLWLNGVMDSASDALRPGSPG